MRGKLERSSFTRPSVFEQFKPNAGTGLATTMVPGFLVAELEAAGLKSVSGFRPARRRNPPATFRTDLIRTSRRQYFLGSGDDVVVELCNLFVVEKFVPRLHSLVGVPIANFP